MSPGLSGRPISFEAIQTRWRSVRSRDLRRTSSIWLAVPVRAQPATVPGAAPGLGCRQKV